MPSSPPPACDATESSHRWLLPTLLIPAFVTLLAVSSVNVILPAVSQDLSAGTAGLQLVVSGYSLVFGVVLVPAGRAGDVMGRGRIFVIGMILFGVGSLASGLAPDVVTLNLARVVMGVGSGLLNPQVSGMIQQFYSGESRGRASSAGSEMTGAGAPPSSSTSRSSCSASGPRTATCRTPPGTGRTVAAPPAGAGSTSTRWAWCCSPRARC